MKSATTRLTTKTKGGSIMTVVNMKTIHTVNHIYLTTMTMLLV